MERETTKLSTLGMAPTTNVLGETYTKLDHLLESRNLTHEKAWGELRSIADGLERAIKELRKQLGAT